MPTTMLAVALGAVAGALLRFTVTLVLAPRGGWPLATLLVNLAGRLAIGAFAGLASRHPALADWRPLLVTGLLGSLTTFSAFSIELVMLFERGQPWHALGYALASVGAGVALAYLGFVLGRL